MTKFFSKKVVTLASMKELSLENAQIYLAFYSLIRTFAPKIYNYGDKESRIHPKRPDGVDVSG